MATLHHKVYEKKFPLSLTASVNKVSEMRKCQERRLVPARSPFQTHTNASRESCTPEISNALKGRGENLGSYLLAHRRKSLRRSSIYGENYGELITQSRRHSIHTRASTTQDGEPCDRDKKAKSSFLKNLRMQHAKQLYQKFRITAKMAVFCIKTVKSHNLRNKLYDEITPYISSLHFYDNDMPVEGVDLMFDPSIYKADKQLRISDDAIKILSKPASERTQKDLYYCQLCLRNIKSFSDYPMRMQRKIVEVGQYERYEAKRIIVRQGYPASAFYFILSGSVVVMVSENNSKVAKPVAYMSKGTTFGELAIINRTQRQATIVAKTTLELLSIDIEDFHRIFMAGGVKNINDPDHDQFVKSLQFLQGWPIDKLADDPTKCIFHYFKRGEIMAKDSNYSDWVYVVKSGSMQVMKKLKRVTPYGNVKKLGVSIKKVLSDKEKREEYEIRVKQRRFVLPDINIPTRRAEEVDAEDSDDLVQISPLPEIEEVTNAHADQGHDPDEEDLVLPQISRESTTAGDRPLTASGEQGRGEKDSGSGDRQDCSSLHSLPTQELSKQSNGNTATCISPRTLALKGPRVQSKKKANMLAGKNAVKSKDDEDFEADIRRKQELRTINDDFDAKYKMKKPDELTEADIDPQFVHVQTVTKGQVFGLSQTLLGKQPSFCVISSGVECIMIDKLYYLQHAPDDLIRRMRQESCPYPTDEDMQEDLQIAVDWAAYKALTFKNTLKSINFRYTPRDASYDHLYQLI